MQKLEFKRYARLLGEWVAFARRDLYVCPDAEGVICYGPGLSSNWGMQTHMKALSAFAVAASIDGIDFGEGLTREKVMSESLSMLRYALRTHLVGDYVCTNGERWGHSWIYALGIERMFHAIEILWEMMSEDDKELLKRMLTSESDFLLDEYEIVAGTVQNNKPESNIWNGALLYRTAELYPELPRREAYIEKAQRFFANGISIESDENSDEIVSGRRIGDMFVGANMFDSYACNHHKYLNVGYMNICISNIAMLHFFMKGRGKRCDDIVYHHLYEQWRLIRSTTFDDGRLVRVGGDTRVCYSYCQDYALPAWSVIEDVYGEDCSMLENGWLEKLEREFKANGDGSFISDRCGYFEEYSTVYYTRLETDRANSISLALWWHKKFALDCDGKCDTLPIWRDEYHGAAFSLGEKRFSSFSFRAAEQPTGLLFRGGSTAAAQHCLDTSQHFLHFKGLGDIIIRAGPQAADLVVGLALGGEHDDGGLALSPDGLTYCPAIHHRHHDIQQHQIRANGMELAQTGTAVKSHGDGIAFLFQIHLQQFCNIMIIFHNQNGQCHI